MDLRESLRTGLTICALVAPVLLPRTAQSLLIDAGGGKACPSMGSYEIHTVRRGENLWDIARRYFGEVAARWPDGKIMFHYPTDIAEANGIKTSDYLREGQELIIPYQTLRCVD